MLRRLYASGRIFVLRCIFCGRSDKVRGLQKPDKKSWLCEDCGEAILLWTKQGLM